MHYPSHVVPCTEFNHLMKVKFVPKNDEGNLTTCLSPFKTISDMIDLQDQFCSADSLSSGQEYAFPRPTIHKDQPSIIKSRIYVGTSVAQLVKCPTSTRVMISRFMGSSPTSGSVLTAQSLEPLSDSVSPSLSTPPPLMLCLFQK